MLVVVDLSASNDRCDVRPLAADVEGTRLTELGVVLSARTSSSSCH